MKKSELQKISDRRAYKIFTTVEQDCYWDEGIRFYPTYRRGFKNSKKCIERYKMRMHRTWKHNRKTKYKIGP